MRLLLATMAACMMLLVATPTMAQDCRAIQRACVASCIGGSGATGDLNQVMRVVPERVRLASLDVQLRLAIKRRLRPVSVMQPLNVFATAGFKPVAMLAYPRPRRLPLRSRVRRRVRPSVAANSRHVCRSANAT